MIVPGTRMRLAVVALSQILVTEHQPRYPERALHYERTLSDPAHTGQYTGPVSLVPCGRNSLTGEPLYTLLDGHHRYVGSILAGRSSLLALIIEEPGKPPDADGDMTGVVTVEGTIIP